MEYKKRRENFPEKCIKCIELDLLKENLHLFKNAVSLLRNKG